MHKYDEAYKIALRGLIDTFVIDAQDDNKSVAETTEALVPLGSAGTGTENYAKVRNLVEHIILENDTEDKTTYHPFAS